MAFGFPSGGGNIIPRIKYDARSGRMFRVDRVKGASGDWESKDVDITGGAVFLVHRGSLKKGWRNFKTFDERAVPIADPLPDRPGGLDAEGKPEYRPIIKMLVKLGPNVGADVRELSISASTCFDSIEALVTEWSAVKEHATDDHCPVVRLEGSQPLKLRNGTAYVPTWRMMGWRPMPSDLAEVADGQDKVDAMATMPPPPSNGFDDADYANASWDNAPAPTTAPAAAMPGDDTDDLPF